MPVEFLREAEGFKDNDVYPDNVQAVSVFVDMLTQWRVGMNGATGLDYTALPVVLSIRRIKLADREDVFECVRVMESAALAEMQNSTEQ